MNKEIIKSRLKAIRRHLSKKSIKCLIITNPPNVTYITNFSGGDSWAIVTPDSSYLLTDSRYIEQAQKQCLCCSIIERTGPIPEAVSKMTKKIKSLQSASVEKCITVAAFDTLKKNLDIKLRKASPVIETLRITKGRGEIAAIKKAAQIVASALQKIRRKIKPGVTENHLAGALDFEIRKLGAANSFETIVAFGPNASRPHHQPTIRKLKNNDTALFDFGAKYKGYCSDLTRCFTVGKTTAFYTKVYNAVKEAQQAAIQAIKPGIKINEIDAAARKVIKKYDLPVFGHGTGHGLGLEVHEGPVIAEKTRGKLLAGMVFTIEPGIYIPGKVGVRIEDDVLVTENGFKILSS